MSALSLPHTRRSVLAASAAAGAVGLLAPTARAAPGDEAIRPFRFNASDEALADLRRRVAGTKWPSQELFTVASKGVQLATMRELARYWQTDYSWRKFEAKLNALPQFTTTIDGLEIHFIHVRSKNKNALPLIITHGWPGSIIEQMKIIDPLTNLTGVRRDRIGRFRRGHSIIARSRIFREGRPNLGWDPICIARAWAVLDESNSATRDMRRKAAIGVMRSPSRWRCNCLRA